MNSPRGGILVALKLGVTLTCPRCSRVVLLEHALSRCPQCSASLHELFDPSQIDTSTGTVLAHVACRRCGYDLYSLFVNGHCPECAHPVLASLLPRTEILEEFAHLLAIIGFTSQLLVPMGALVARVNIHSQSFESILLVSVLVVPFIAFTAGSLISCRSTRRRFARANLTGLGLTVLLLCVALICF